LKKQLRESQENQSNTDVKVNNLLVNIRTLQEEKKSIEAKLTQTQTSYQAQVCLFFMSCIPLTRSVPNYVPVLKNISSLKNVQEMCQNKE